MGSKDSAASQGLGCQEKEYCRSIFGRSEAIYQVEKLFGQQVQMLD